MKVSKEELRNYYLNYHGFNEFFDLNSDIAVQAIFDRIRSVQFDPLNVAGRNAELVLFARNRNFTKQALHNALYRDRILIDGWDKMMCIYSRSEFPCFARVREQMVREYNGIISWRKQSECYDRLDEIYSYVEQNGPVLITDIPSSKTNNGRWGPTKTAGVCCEYLWFGGKIVIVNKKGIVKVFDTADKALGALNDVVAFADEHSFLQWYVKRRIACTGALWNKNGGAWLGAFLEKKDCRTAIIDELKIRGEIDVVEVEGVKDPFYICKGDDKFFTPFKSDRAIIIAPLDNMIWDRKLVKSIFDFDYSWEVYVPQDKRKYGYYVLPIVVGNRFIGRVEPEQYKNGKPLRIKNVWYERGYSPTLDDIDLIVEELTRLARFLGTDIDKSVSANLVPHV